MGHCNDGLFRKGFDCDEILSLTDTSGKVYTGLPVVFGICTPPLLSFRHSISKASSGIHKPMIRKVEVEDGI